MQIAKASFQRVSPAEFAKKVELPAGWIVVRYSHVGPKLTRRKTHARWVAITSDRATVFRIVRYSVDLPADRIVIDWAGWIDLQGRTDEEVDEIELTITTARWYQFFTLPFRHVDPSYRLSAWLGGISVGLGVLSIILSIALSSCSSSSPNAFPVAVGSVPVAQLPKPPTHEVAPALVGATPRRLSPQP